MEDETFVGKLKIFTFRDYSESCIFFNIWFLSYHFWYNNNCWRRRIQKNLGFPPLRPLKNPNILKCSKVNTTWPYIPQWFHCRICQYSQNNYVCKIKGCSSKYWNLTKWRPFLEKKNQKCRFFLWIWFSGWYQFFSLFFFILAGWTLAFYVYIKEEEFNTPVLAGGGWFLPTLQHLP